MKKNAISTVLFIGAFSILFEILSFNEIIPKYILPPPSDIFLSWRDDSAVYLEALWTTFASAFLGLLVSLSVGVFLAILFALSEPLKNILLPICVFFQTVPIIAVAPLMVIWFGFGRPTVIASTVVVSFFPVLANSLLGLSGASRESHDLFSLMKASRWHRLFHLQVPAAVPQIFTGFEIAAGLAIVGALVGEFVGGGGLGGLIDSAKTQQKIEVVFGSVILSSFLGFSFIKVIHGLKFFFKNKLRK